LFRAANRTTHVSQTLTDDLPTQNMASRCSTGALKMLPVS
jgi:hypothetical protein